MKSLLLKVAAMAALFAFIGCGTDLAEDDIKWTDDNGGTLEVFNGSAKDIIVFYGQVPAEKSMMGGVRAGATKLFDIGKHFTDFEAGGYTILKGMTRDEYNANKYNLSEAKVEFRAMATYRRGTKYRIQIDNGGMGEYGFKISNTTNLGVELRKDSPDGEKFTYLGPLESNQMIYFSTNVPFRVFPVYVYLNKSTWEISTLKTADIYSTFTAVPQQLAGASSMATYRVPDDENYLWDEIAKTIKFPYAYVKVRNNMSNQEAAYLSVGANNYLTSQNGYKAVVSGFNETFEIEGSDMEGGVETVLNINIYNFRIQIVIEEEVEEEVDVEKEGEDGEIIIVKEVVKRKQFSNPKLKNGYDYEIVVTGRGQDASGYSAIITESPNQRDISTVIGVH
jgi:hypothetical protein